jgi:hypothetical protein
MNPAIERFPRPPCATKTDMPETGVRFGEPCETCLVIPNTPTPESCWVLGEAVEKRQLERELEEVRDAWGITIEQKEELDRRYHARVERHTHDLHDPKIQGFETTAGIRSRLTDDAALRTMILNLNFGIEQGDGRGLRYINKMAGMWAGDNLLNGMGQRLAGTEGVRLKPTPNYQPDRRRPLPDDVPRQDVGIGFRDGGSDEIGALLVNITPEELEKVHRRVSDNFSVERAMIDDNAGRVPIIASFGSVHAKDVVPRLPAEALEAMNEAQQIMQAERIFTRVVDASRNKLTGEMKATQYNEMWASIRKVCTMQGLSVPRKPREEPDIAALFFKICCPTFASHPRQAMEKLGPYKPSELLTTS